MQDPRKFVEARRAVQARFEGKSVDELALAAAVNTEILLDAAEDYEERIRSLETWRIFLAGGLAVVIVLVPIVVGAMSGGR